VPAAMAVSAIALSFVLIEVDVLRDVAQTDNPTALYTFGPEGVSIGVQTGPPIGAQKGPPLRDRATSMRVASLRCARRSEGVARSERPQTHILLHKSRSNGRDRFG
jgi:hypothetical protein